MTSPEEVLQTVREALIAGDLDTAEASLKDASKRWKKEPEFAARYAGVLVKQGKHAQALKVYRKVMKQAPERLDACKGAAECAIQLGKAKQAEKLYSRATGLGMSLDEATLGISRSLVLRSQHHAAWEKAISQFKASGNKSKELHALLKEISPQTGNSVPVLDQFDSEILDVELEGVRRVAPDPRLSSHSFSAGSIEAMAGVDRTTLVSSGEQIGDELLAAVAGERGHTSLGIDLSALSQPSEVSPQDSTDVVEDELDLSEASQTEESNNGESNVVTDDDPFDDWPEFDI